MKTTATIKAMSAKEAALNSENSKLIWKLNKVYEEIKSASLDHENTLYPVFVDENHIQSNNRSIKIAVSFDISSKVIEHLESSGYEVIKVKSIFSDCHQYEVKW